jgi:hypothetical protein
LQELGGIPTPIPTVAKRCFCKLAPNDLEQAGRSRRNVIQSEDPSTVGRTECRCHSYVHIAHGTVATVAAAILFTGHMKKPTTYPIYKQLVKAIYPF